MGSEAGTWRLDGDWKPDGPVQYYYGEIQQLVGVLPASCRSGKHLLHVVEYTHETITRLDQPSLLVLRCNECPPSDVPWVLMITKARLPDRVELDDSRYRDLRSRLRESATDEDAQELAWSASHDEQPA